MAPVATQRMHMEVMVRPVVENDFEPDDKDLAQRTS
jgi:hypothetical protein